MDSAEGMALSSFWPEGAKFSCGDFVMKSSGSSWRGRVCGFYSTKLTPIGYAIESAFEPNSVQNYPEAALEAWDPAKAMEIPGRPMNKPIVAFMFIALIITGVSASLASYALGNEHGRLMYFDNYGHPTQLMNEYLMHEYCVNRP